MEGHEHAKEAKFKLKKYKQSLGMVMLAISVFK